MLEGLKEGTQAYISKLADINSMYYTLPAIAGLAGATLRLPNSFLISLGGGRNVIFVTTGLLIIPAVGTAIGLSNINTSYGYFATMALLSGFGGGNFVCDTLTAKKSVTIGKDIADGAMRITCNSTGDAVLKLYKSSSSNQSIMILSSDGLKWYTRFSTYNYWPTTDNSISGSIDSAYERGAIGGTIFNTAIDCNSIDADYYYGGEMLAVDLKKCEVQDASGGYPFPSAGVLSYHSSHLYVSDGTNWNQCDN